jgi:hypothetical protein
MASKIVRFCCGASIARVILPVRMKGGGVVIAAVDDVRPRRGEGVSAAGGEGVERSGFCGGEAELRGSRL